MLSSAWALVGKGHSANLNDFKKEKRDHKAIIVSRSHSGKVAEVAKVLGEKTEVIPAGGAGKA